MPTDLSDEDCFFVEQIYQEYFEFAKSRDGVALTRTEWAKSIMNIGDTLGDQNFIKRLITQYRMKKNCNLN
jgi:hypothetical protein